MTAQLDLYWIPLGADTPVVRITGTIFEAVSAFAQRRARSRIYHSALIATIEDAFTTVEMAPTPDRYGRRDRGVVAEGPVGLRTLGRLRTFRYEIRRWPNGHIPDLPYAIASPVCVANEPALVRQALDLLPEVPTPTWGRDELQIGEMWNSNSVISWTLSQAGIDLTTIRPPDGGRAPGWAAGIHVALRPTEISVGANPQAARDSDHLQLDRHV